MPIFYPIGGETAFFPTNMEDWKECLTMNSRLNESTFFGVLDGSFAATDLFLF